MPDQPAPDKSNNNRPDPALYGRVEPAPGLNPVDAAITTRRSVRGFLPDPVPEATLREILEVAARAPSGTNMQPWKVHAVAGAAREKLSAAILAAREEHRDEQGEGYEYKYYPQRWREPYLSRRRKIGYDLYGLIGIEKGDRERMWEYFARNYEFFDAPIGLIFTMDRELEVGSWLDFGMFLQNLMVAARGRGLDTCAQAAFMGFHKTIRAELGIPDDEIMLCGMSLGYADNARPENALVTEREPVDAFTIFHGF